MRAWVFGEAQLEPALQKWFGTQQMTTEQELEFRDRLVTFLASAEGAVLRMTEFDPIPAGAKAP